MRYPTTLQYTESILNPEGLFRSLSGLSSSHPSSHSDFSGLPVFSAPLSAPSGNGAEQIGQARNTSDTDFSSGAYGAVFRVTVSGKPFALKCFTRHQPGRTEAYRHIAATLGSLAPENRTHIIDFRWLDDEITVFGDDGTATRQPVLLMEWVEGQSLTQAIDRAFRTPHPETIMHTLSREFDRLALWLLTQPFAHGDLKPDNIMVRNSSENKNGSNNTLVLIDYDGLYLPDMQGERARETGTEGFRHPGRTENDFGKPIDDYPIALLSLSLRALAAYPELYAEFHNPANLLFEPASILRGECPAYNFVKNTPLADYPLFGMLASYEPRLPGLAEAISGQHMSSTAIKTDPKPDFDYIGEPGTGLCDDIRLVRRSGKYGFVTADPTTTGLFTEITPIIYDRAGEFSEGFAAVALDGKWGYIGTTGESLTEFIYEACGSFSEGLAAVCMGRKWGYIDLTSSLVIRCRFDDVRPFAAEGLALVRRKDKYGFIGRDGRMAIPARYDFAQGFREGAACVMLDGLYGYITPKGRYLVAPMFDYARSKRNGRAYVEQEGKGREIDL